MSSVTSVSNSDIQAVLQQIYATSATSKTSSTSGTTALSSTSGSESVDMSDPGKLFSRLQELSETDPEEFKSTMSTIADKLEEAAESSTDENESSMLTKMAEGFSDAAESGDMSDAMPPPPGGPPPSSTSSETANAINAYTQNSNSTQESGSSAFQSMFSIISGVLQNSTSS